jgi:hypothetical protein
MTGDVGSPEFWSAIEDQTVTLQIGEPTWGLWCPDCNLSTGWWAPIDRDPAQPSGSWLVGCDENHEHRRVRRGCS